jgi:hypothetical protein
LIRKLRARLCIYQLPIISNLQWLTSISPFRGAKMFRGGFLV